jgi:hypothetical protein
MAGHPEKTPIDGKDSRLRSFRLRQPPRAATQRQPRQRKHRPFRGVPPPFFFFAEACWETVPGVVAVFCALASRGRSPCAWQCRCSALCCSRWCCAAGVAAAHWVCSVCGGRSTRTADLASTHEKAPLPRQQEQRVSGDFPKKQKHRKSLWRPVAAVAGCFAAALPCGVVFPRAYVCRWFRARRAPVPVPPAASLLVLPPTVCCRGTREGPAVACVPTGLGRLFLIRRTLAASSWCPLKHLDRWGSRDVRDQ